MSPQDNYSVSVLMTAAAVTVIFCAGFPVTLVVIIPALIGLLMGLKCVKDI